MFLSFKRIATTRPSLLGWLGLFFSILLFSSCKTEEDRPVPNIDPATTISIDHIELNGENRLITQLQLHWAGTDQDGYVTGFRISWGQDSLEALSRLASSQIVTQTDSTFLFNFTQVSGQGDTSDIYFFVQAIDDKGLADPEPATLRLPLKNSRPSISFLDDGLSLADTIWSVLSFPYTFSDPDGDANIDSIYIKVNDGQWVGVPKNIRFISLVPSDPSAFGETTGLIYAGENLATLNKEPAPVPNVLVPGLQINGQNRVFLKIKDLAGSTHMDTTGKSYYIKRKTADLLIIDAYLGSSIIGDSLYYNLIGSITPYDRFDLAFQQPVGGFVNQPKFWNATFYLLNKLYKKTFWYSDLFSTLVGEVPLLLSYASASFNQVLRFNGKLLISMTFPDPPTQLGYDDPIFSLLPIDSITKQSNLVRVRKGFPVIPRQMGFDTLTIFKFPNDILSGVDLMYPKAGVDTLYIIPKSSLASIYTGPPLPIAIKTKNPLEQKTNLVLFSMEMANLNGDRNALKSTFTKIFNDEFNW